MSKHVLSSEGLSSQERSSLEGEIKAKAKTGSTISSTSWHDFDKSNPFMKTTKEERRKAEHELNEWLTKEWVSLHDVLVVLRQHEATRSQQLHSSDFLEQLAELEHEQWVSWIKHMHTLRSSEVNYVYAQQWKEWLRKSQTEYIELTEDEKESDRKFARKVIEKFEELKP